MHHLIFDYNGDGKEDFVYVQRQQNVTSAIHQRHFIYLGNGSQITPLNGKIVSTAYPGSGDQIFGKTFSGDFDGDGKSELFVVPTSTSPQNSIGYLIGQEYCTLTTTTGPNTNNTIPYPVVVAKAITSLGFNASDDKKLFVIDYNGDGKSEIMYIDGSLRFILELNVTYNVNNKPVIGSPAFNMISLSGYPTTWHEIFPGDFNGDGITDVLTCTTAGLWEIGYGNGAGNFDLQPFPYTMTRVTANPAATDIRPLIVADFNGDGKSDIFDFCPSDLSSLGPTYLPRIYYSKGNNAFIQENVPMSEDLLGHYASWYIVGDYNGDGAMDLFTKRTALPSGRPYVISFHPHENAICFPK